MQLVKREQIEVRDRQRKERPANAVSDLKASILSKGLFHTPTVWEENGKFILNSGETRLLAIDELAKEGLFFLHDGRVVTPGEVPVTLVTDLSEADLFEAELEENEYRTPLSWIDRAKALARLHALRQGANPEQTYLQTAEEISSRVNRAPSTLRGNIREATIVAKHLDNPTIANARNFKEAVQLVLKQEERSVQAELISRRIKANTVNTDVLIRRGDMTTLLPALPPAEYDLICADPPYGIDAGNAGARSRTVHHHNYADDIDTARNILQFIIQEGFRLAKPRANLFMFGDIDLFDLFKRMTASMGWVPFRTPLTWRKSESEGLAPWGASGPRRTCEWIFYATKGQKGLLESPVDIFDIRRVARNEREYGAEKPVDLMKAIIQCSTLPNDAVLDPCCGSGSTLLAAKLLKRRGLGIELDEAAFNLAVSRVMKDDDDEPELPLTSTSTEELV